MARRTPPPGPHLGGHIKGQREIVQLSLRKDQIRRLPAKDRSAHVTLWLLAGLKLDWPACDHCGQDIRPDDRGPYQRVTVSLPVDLSHQLADRWLATRSHATAATFLRELIDRALTAE